MLLKRPHRRPRQKSPQLLDDSGSEEGCIIKAISYCRRVSKQGRNPLVLRRTDGLTQGEPVPAIALRDDVMTTLVIGATGIVGGYIVDRLLQAGERRSHCHALPTAVRQISNG